MTLVASSHEEPRLAHRTTGIWEPFRIRDFRLLWIGMLFANVGSWMQFVALGYYVAKLAPNAAIGSFYIGLLGASRMIPVLLCSPIAGVVADCYPRRRTLLITNGANAIISVVLAAAIFTDVGSLWAIMLLSALSAGAQSFDNPARQSWVSTLVPRESMGNAIGLNSLSFNGPAVIGPPLAGLVIAAVGVSTCMAINAATLVFAAGMIFFMQPVAASTSRSASFLSTFIEGVRFIYQHPILRWVILMIVVTSLTSRSYNFLLPAYAVHVLDLDAGGLGLLMGAAGLGALTGAFAVAAIQSRRRSRMWVVALAISSLGVVVLGLVRGSLPAAATLFILGASTQAFVGSSNVMLQTLAPEGMRGRALSVYTMVMMGLVPGGALLCGALAMLADLRVVFIGAGVFATLVGAWVYLAHPRLRAS